MIFVELYFNESKNEIVNKNHSAKLRQNLVMLASVKPFHPAQQEQVDVLAFFKGDLGSLITESIDIAKGQARTVPVAIGQLCHQLKAEARQFHCHVAGSRLPPRHDRRPSPAGIGGYSCPPVHCFFSASPGYGPPGARRILFTMPDCCDVRRHCAGLGVLMMEAATPMARWMEPCDCPSIHCKHWTRRCSGMNGAYSGNNVCWYTSAIVASIS